MKYILKLLKANLRVSISRFGACILLFGNREHSLVTLISSS
jgi:hypothetical protein